MAEPPRPRRSQLSLYREDLERYERMAANAREAYGAEHPLTKLWERRGRTVTRVIDYLEDGQPGTVEAGGRSPAEEPNRPASGDAPPAGESASPR